MMKHVGGDCPVASGIVALGIAHADDVPDIVGVCRIVGDIVDERHQSEQCRCQDNQYFAPPYHTDGG
ncbi:hypothetical protein D3C72_2278970 [compost metagenome]